MYISRCSPKLAWYNPVKHMTVYIENARKRQEEKPWIELNRRASRRPYVPHRIKGKNDDEDIWKQLTINKEV
jgi:hypothetical protein